MNKLYRIDVSKQTLKVFDGTKEYDVSNDRGLKPLKKLFKKNYAKMPKSGSILD